MGGKLISRTTYPVPAWHACWSGLSGFTYRQARMHDEERRPVVGYEGLYTVTRTGEVYREPGRVTNRAGVSKDVQGGLKVPSPNEKGYLRAYLWKAGKVKALKVHRLVALAYLPNPDGLPEVDHLNFRRDDNRASNLEWVTHAENMRRARAAGRLRSPRGARGPVGVAHPRAKLDEAKVRDARHRRSAGTATGRALAREYGVNPTTISAAVTGRTWAHVE